MYTKRHEDRTKSVLKGVRQDDRTQSWKKEQQVRKQVVSSTMISKLFKFTLFLSFKTSVDLQGRGFR